jgi:carbamoyl-phosphate synthase large subunit
MTNQNIPNTEVEFQKWLKQSDAYLHFPDGTKFKGKINRTSYSEEIIGEAAFTTGMSGYEETITDPSFLGQHIVFSTAHVGNYEANKAQRQAKKSFATSIIARNFSHSDLWKDIDVPLISGIDSRALVKYLSQESKDHRCLITNSSKAPTNWQEKKLICDDLHLVSQTSVETIVAGENPIVLVNYGVKQAIVNRLKGMGYPLVTTPYNISSAEITKLSPRLIFLSNGPGDPRNYHEQINVVRELLATNIPVRGICLGHQLLGLALNAKAIKLPFGQRGVNHPVLDHVSGDLLITSQNHGYALDEDSLVALQNNNLLGRELLISHRSLFDRSVEGLTTSDHHLKSVQFHPEAHPGPSDADVFFQEIEQYLKVGRPQDIDSKKLEPLKVLGNTKIQKDLPKKLLLIGSGPIKIGQASEFDYSGTQALKSLKEIGVSVVLLNSNPATIMTDPEMCTATYIEPITKEVIKKIIDKENVDAILSTMGGQTALNICVELEKEGYLATKNVKLLGANVWTIEHTEDRELFAKELDKLGYQTGKRFKAFDENETIELAGSTVGFPLIIRRDFALGGKGAALFHNKEELKEIFNTDIKFPITMEKSLIGYKEIELEVMVDCEKNGIIICSIENVDPCGIHTGDSITVAPAQTISDRCYQKLRTMSLTIAKHMGVVAGGANVQFAINPNDEDDIVVIEMNPRVSRSSALASKATGYPIAKISALLAVGYTLKEILNDITKASPVAFEPTLDYVALKIPIFPFNKFPTSSRVLGPQMRSVGEVLSLGGNFNEAFLKALRSLEMGLEIPGLNRLKTTPLIIDRPYLEKRLSESNELSMLTCLEALRIGMSVDEIHKLTAISKWFIEQMAVIVSLEDKVKGSEKLENLSAETLREAKVQGFSDKHIALLLKIPQSEVFKWRRTKGLAPVYKAVDTCSAEFKAYTPYFYSTYSEVNEAKSLKGNGQESIAILGSGPNRIGQGIEFDYSCVKSCQHLKSKKISSIMINSNPETVSTDYDSSDRLYLSALYSEDLFDILLNENPSGVIASFSGQTGIYIREHLEKGFRSQIASFNFLGPSLKTLELTEDRKLFSLITRDLPLSQTNSIEVQGYKNLENALIEIGFPVIIRPSYVIGGESMYIFHDFADVNELPAPLLESLKTSTATFQVENYLEEALEYDVDLVRDKFGNTVFTVCEHIEYAGVHSGDSGMISPPVILTSKLYDKMKKISEEMAAKLEVVGPINFQFAVKDGKIYCIEANPRGSRTLPFLSKAYHLSLPSIATDAMLGEKIQNWDRESSPYFCVKQSTFPFDRFIQDNIILGPKMRSTGETMGIDTDKEAAILKSYLGNYPGLLYSGKILLSLADDSKEAVLPYLKQLSKKGYRFLATRGTCQYIVKQGLPCQLVAKINEEGLSILEALKDEEIRLVFNTPMNRGSSKSDGENIRNTAIQYGIPCFTRTENIKAVMEAIIGTENTELSPLSLQEMKL